MNVILGVTVDTSTWVAQLRDTETSSIVVLDYDYIGDPEYREGVLHLSSIDTKDYIEKFDSVRFYKSLYVYPVMGGHINSL